MISETLLGINQLDYWKHEFSTKIDPPEFLY